MASIERGIEVLGINLGVSGKADDAERIDHILECLQAAVEETQNRHPKLSDPLKVALMTVFYAYDKYLDLCDRHALEQELSIQEEQETEKITRSLIARIDEALEDRG